ncbi:MAG TPA: flagellar basal body P-ring formation chaperone FlgA [Rhodospirillales bacterium]
MKKLTFALLLVGLLTPATTLAAGGKTVAKLQSGEAKPEATLDQHVMIREAVSVNSRLVRLGDIFTGVGDKADITVAYAPEPGKRAIFDARWLYRAARAYGLEWRPLSLQDQVVVERESLTVSRDEIEDTIRAALIERGVDPTTQVELSNRMMRIYIPGNATATIGVEDVAWEPRTGRFNAVLAAPAGDPAATRVRVTGTMHRMIEVPVLVKRAAAKDVFTERDVRMIKVRQDRLPKDVIVDASELIGKAAKRGLRADTPIMYTAVQQPVLVPKGSIVTILLHMPKMTLTTQGKALDDGTEGDVIRISNTRSHKIIEGEVTGAGRVTVKSTNMLALN